MRIENGKLFDDSIDMKFQRGKAKDHKQTRIFKVKIPLLELFGFAFYLGWIFCLFWSPSLFPSGFYSDQSIHVIRIVMTIAMFAAYIIFGAMARFLATAKGDFSLKVIALAFSPMACFLGFLPPEANIVVACVLWFLSGIGSSALLLVWAKKLVGLNRKQIIMSVSGGFMVGAFLFLSTSLLASEVACIAITTLPFVSVVFAFSVASQSPSVSAVGAEKLLEPDQNAVQRDTNSTSMEGKSSPKDGKKTMPRISFENGEKVTFMRTILLAFAYSVGIGFTGSSATVFEYYPENVYIIAAANIIAGIFTVLFLIRRSRNIGGVLTEIFLPCILLCIFLFSFVGHSGQLACFFFMFALLACHDIVDIANVSKSSTLFGENYVKTFAFGRVLNGVGCTFGWVVGYLLYFTPNIELSGRLFVCFALVVFLVVMTSFAVFHPGPFSYSNQTPIISFSFDQLDGEEQRQGEGVQGETLLDAKVQKIARHYDLTSRQAEVLLYLAQGRNANYIGQKFTISNHTAKSHIYNIYTKLEVHSQQELLDIIESMDSRVPVFH